MRIICPHCQADYEAPDLSPDATLVCYRCGEEFPVADGLQPTTTAEDEATAQPSLFASEGNADSPIAAGEQQHSPHDHQEDRAPLIIPAREMDLEPSEPEALPARKPVKLWPWLMSMLIVVAGAGFWVQKDAWMNNLWFRSTLLNLGYAVEVRDQDWRILPDSVRSEWMPRDDGSRVLVITGRLSNQLASDLTLPELNIDLYASNIAIAPVETRTVPITLPPMVDVITHAPFQTPEADRVPVAPHSQRSFIVVLESVPQPLAYFTLTPKATRP